MIMALGECDCVMTLPVLRGLASERFWATMRQVSVGDALIRLSHVSDTNPAPVFEALDLARRNDTAIAEGAMRAVAMLRLRFEGSVVDRLIREVSALEDEAVNYWTAGACAGWSGPVVREFLEACLTGKEFTRDVATASLRGEYKRYNPA